MIKLPNAALRLSIPYPWDRQLENISLSSRVHMIGFGLGAIGVAHRLCTKAATPLLPGCLSGRRSPHAFFSVPVSAILLLTAAICATGQTISVSLDTVRKEAYIGRNVPALASQPELGFALRHALAVHQRNPGVPFDKLIEREQQNIAKFREEASKFQLFNPFADENWSKYLRIAEAASAFIPEYGALLPLGFAAADLAISKYNGSITDGLDQAEKISAATQRLLGSMGNLDQSRTLLRTCFATAENDLAWRACMDGLLQPETGVSVNDTTDKLLSGPGSQNNPTMNALSALTKENAHLNISIQQLTNLFTSEMNLLREQAKQAQKDALYQEKIEAATAAVSILGTFIRIGGDEKLATEVETVGKSTIQIVDAVGKLKDAGFARSIIESGNILGAVMNIIGLFGGGPSPEEIILQEVREIRSLIVDLSEQMNARFDRVDKALNQIYRTINERFDQIDLTTGEILDNVQNIREALADVQLSLHRLERQLYDYLNAGFRQDLLAQMNLSLGYETTFGLPLDYVPTYINAENDFFTWAVNIASDPLRSPWPVDSELTDDSLLSALSRPLESNLNYFNRFLNVRLGIPLLSSAPLANPREWFVGANAYLELSTENPTYCRRISVNRLDAIIATGQRLEDFCQGLSFTNSAHDLRVTTRVYDSIVAYHRAKTAELLDRVHDEESKYASTNKFDVETWRNWAVAAPRVKAKNASIEGALRLGPLPKVRRPGGGISAGYGHNLVKRLNGTVLAWGANGAGQSSAPVDLNAVSAVAAGWKYSIALLSNGTVTAWGENTYGQTDVPATLTNVIAVSAGLEHGLALRADGTLVGWGHNIFGEAAAPAGSNFAAIAAGDYHNIALTREGTVFCWGDNTSGQCNAPQTATNVVAVAAGSAHSLALQRNGTVIAWGWNEFHQCDVPRDLTNVVAISAGPVHNLALKDDGSVVGWGDNFYGQTNVPITAHDVIAVAAGSDHSLVLKRDGTVVAWGANYNDQLRIPRELTWTGALSYFASGLIAIADGDRAIAWGYNQHGLANRVEVPVDTTNIVMVAGGYPSAALTRDGTTVFWGYNGGLPLPSRLTNIVRITSGLALSQDGRPIAFGARQPAVPTNVTNIVKSPGTCFGIWRSTRRGGYLRGATIRMDSSMSRTMRRMLPLLPQVPRTHSRCAGMGLLSHGEIIDGDRAPPQRA
jgi:hypothetical protein